MKNKVLPFAEKWTELENIMVNEINQTPMVRSIVFSVQKKSEGREAGRGGEGKVEIKQKVE